jgi:hypothetical protein
LTAPPPPLPRCGKRARAHGRRFDAAALKEGNDRPAVRRTDLALMVASRADSRRLGAAIWAVVTASRFFDTPAGNNYCKAENYPLAPQHRWWPWPLIKPNQRTLPAAGTDPLADRLSDAAKVSPWWSMRVALMLASAKVFLAGWQVVALPTKQRCSFHGFRKHMLAVAVSEPAGGRAGLVDAARSWACWPPPRCWRPMRVASMQPSRSAGKMNSGDCRRF